MDVIALEQRQRLDLGVVELDPVHELWVDPRDIVTDLLVELRVVDDHRPVVVVEFLAHDPHTEVRLAVEQLRSGRTARL